MTTGNKLKKFGASDKQNMEIVKSVRKSIMKMIIIMY